MKFCITTVSAGVLLHILASCGNTDTAVALTRSGLDPQKFVTEVDGRLTALFTLTNANGVEACITNYGGRLVSLMVPDASGKFTDVVLGHDSIADYINIDGNFGALIGRYGNRINRGRFTLDGVTYQLPCNNYGHCLHGGDKGYHHSVWNAEQPDDTTLYLSLRDAYHLAGFPGNVDVKVVYKLTSDNAIDIAYEAVTDTMTIINLTNHSYFNLSGNHSRDILDHIVTIAAEGFTPIDSTFMTTGEIASVADTPFDFRQGKSIGQDINAENEQLSNGHGYDHNFVLSAGCEAGSPAVTVVCPTTGIRLDMFTTEPGVQFYTGNFLDGTVTGKGGVTYPHRGALCLESQHYPDSPNKPDWQSVVLRPGAKYTSRCIYRFTTE